MKISFLGGARTVTGSRAPTLYYACATSTTSPYRIFQPEPCPSKNNPSYKYQMDKFYSCADPTSASDSVLGQRVNEKHVKGQTVYNYCTYCCFFSIFRILFDYLYTLLLVH